MNVETLKDYRLTLDDWLALAALGAGVLTPKPIHVEMLVLAGLVERDEDRPVLTSEGREAAGAIDMIFDWDEFAFAESPESPSDASETVFLNGKPIKRSEALEMESKRPKPLSVGSLVRHIPTGGVGLITKHTMYDADWGGFYVDFVKPVDNVIDGRVVNQLSRMFDRGDKFERV
tara:strand:+ start:329 stop:853 length:525 start_codon:yes stop_codon:yes gene_type:complete